MPKRKRLSDTQPMRAVREQPAKRGKRGCLTYLAYAFIGIIAIAMIGQAGNTKQSPATPRQVAPASTSAGPTSKTPIQLATSTRQAAAQPTQEQPQPAATAQPASLRSSSPQSVDIAFSAPRQWYTTGNANVRSCPSTTCGVVDTYAGGESVTLDASTEGQAVNSGNSQWYRVYGSGYIYSGVVSSSAPVVQQAVQQVPQTQPEQPADAGQPTQPPAVVQRRPANCDEAKAMGLTAQQAAQWPHLDRDGDGVACYGD